jgi:hypothetical protein
MTFLVRTAAMAVYKGLSFASSIANAAVSKGQKTQGLILFLWPDVGGN